MNRYAVATAFTLLLFGCGNDRPAAVADTPAPAAARSTGEDVVQKACLACHGAGIAGAPKIGDVAAWQPRLAQSTDVLHQHAIAGFTGRSGVMPPKGGFMNLSDDQVRAAVDYMVDQVN